MEVVACTPQACKSICHEYGIFFVPSVCQRHCGSRMEGHSCIRTKVSAEDVSSDGTNLHYPGDEKMHKNTPMNKKKHGTSNIGHIECDDHIKRVSYLQYLDEKKPRGAKKMRLCTGNMTLLKQHLNSMKRVHLASCQMCGKQHTWSVRYARSMFVSRVERT
jgi:hypothetical protein